MPLVPIVLLQAAAGGGAAVAAQDVPHPVPAPDQSTPQLTTPSKDAHMGADFHTSPVRSSHTPLVDHPSGGMEDPITLTALSFVVSTLVQKVHSLENELHDHKKLFKNVVGKLVKKVKSLEVKLKTKKRKMVVSDSDEEDGNTPNVNLEALRALANATVANDSDDATDPAATSTTPAGASTVTPGASGVAPSASGIPLGGSVAPTAASTVSADISQVPPGAPNKGKSPMIEEDIPVPARTLRQMEEDRLGEEASRQIHEEDMAEIERERAKAQRKRQQEVLKSVKFYNADDWLTIQAQVEANASLSKTLLGDDVSEDNFPARMAALIKKKRQALAEQLFKERQNRPLTLAQQKAYMRQYVKNQSSAIYNTGWSMVYVKSFSNEQLLQEFEKIHKVHTQSQLQSFIRTFKRPGSVLEEPPTKRPKSPEAPTPSMPEIPIPPAVTSPPSSHAPAQAFLKVIVDEDSDDVDSVNEAWSAVVGWEILSTPLGGKGSSIWQNQHLWEIRSWRLYTLSNVHILETMSGEVLSMFTDVPYLLSVERMKKMLMIKLEIDSDFVGNDQTTAEQLI
nr:JmjC domain-containing protein [Tanacetum cinerariifolium]